MPAFFLIMVGIILIFFGLALLAMIVYMAVLIIRHQKSKLILNWFRKSNRKSETVAEDLRKMILHYHKSNSWLRNKQILWIQAYLENPSLEKKASAELRSAEREHQLAGLLMALSWLIAVSLGYKDLVEIVKKEAIEVPSLTNPEGEDLLRKYSHLIY